MTSKKQASKEATKKTIKSIVGAASGNLVEWFDFYIYAVFVEYFKDVLIPGNLDSASKSLYAWGIFAASFFMRPIGSWLFGWIGDRYGRKQSMMLSIILMSFSSFLFAALPSYDSVGMLSPILLLLVRLLQGLSVGGEYGTVATYMSEVALKGRKGFFASFQYATLSGGQLLANLLGVIMLFFMSEQQLLDGGWRLPFLIGGVVALLSLLMRSHLEETSNAQTRQNKDSGSLRNLLKNHGRSFLTVVGFTSAGSLAFYTITVYSRAYIAEGLSPETLGIVMTISLLIFMLAQPFFGHLADQVGTKKVMLLFSALTALFIYPVMAIAMKTYAHNPYIICALLSFMMILLSFYTSIGGLIKAEMFPMEVRALGVGLSFAIGNAIFGGSAPALALQFKSAGYENSFFVYVVIMLVICFLISLSLPNKPKHLHQEEHE